MCCKAHACGSFLEAGALFVMQTLKSEVMRAAMHTPAEGFTTWAVIMARGWTVGEWVGPTDDVQYSSSLSLSL